MEDEDGKSIDVPVGKRFAKFTTAKYVHSRIPLQGVVLIAKGEREEGHSLRNLVRFCGEWEGLHGPEGGRYG